MYRDRRDVKDIPIPLRLSERQLLKVLAVSARRGTQFAATVRDLLMEAVLMAEHDSAAKPENVAANQHTRPFNCREGASCRNGNPSLPRLPPPSASGSRKSPSGAESTSTRPLNS